MGLPCFETEVQVTGHHLCTQCQEVKTTKGTEKLFLKSVSVWINKPHVVNRRLCGSKIVHVRRVHKEEEASAVVDEYKLYGKENVADTNVKDDSHITSLVDEATDFTVIIRELIPKSEFFPKLLEAVVYDKQKVKVSFIPIGQDCTGKTEDLRPTEELQYDIELQNDDENLPELACDKEIKLVWSCDHNESQQPRRQITSKWLRKTLLEKLVSWSEVSDISTSVTSLQLVAVDKYKDTYIRLKNTYGRELVKNWTERTNPEKFVYEDVAIAAYLLLIWEEDRKAKKLPHKQSFVDLGCGNGLLVYILTKEGYKGLGIDLRKRNIWDTFGPDVKLREEVISPSADHLYPEYDWIIGNHSDELTPWIPVIAARSSYNTNFFLLPCCPHDFVGKFSLTEKGKSRYGSYIEYVKNIIIHCGFRPETDTLRIPSTKRICLIGRKRSYDQKNESERDMMRQAFIEKRTIHSMLHVSLSQQTVIDAKNCTEKLFGNGHCAKKCTSLPTDGAEDCMQVSDTRTNESSIEQGSVIATRQDKYADNHIGDTEEFASASSAASSQDYFYSSPSGDKRKYENLSSADSGFYELESEDSTEHDTTKRLKHSCHSEGSNKCENSGQENSQSGDRSSVIVSTPSSALISEDSPYLTKNGRNDCNAYLTKEQQWVKDFQPRVEQGVRNCQKVPEEVKSRIVQTVFRLVLDAPDARSVLLSSGKTWAKGGSVPLCEVAAQFDKSTMQELKNEYGGLQTLLRNHSHVFQVTGGHVQLRDFTAPDPWIGCNVKKAKNKRGNQQDSRKTTLCWFDANHPNGCPRSQEVCQFAHGIEELRNKLSRKKLI